MRFYKALSNVVVGLILAIAVVGALSAIVWWARQRASSMPQSVEQGVQISAYYIKGTLVIANPGSRSYTVRVLCEDGSTVATITISARKLVTSTVCVARWLVVGGRLIDVVVVLR